MTQTQHGRLIIIGGHEDKTGDQMILQKVVDQVKKNTTLLISTVASTEPNGAADDYIAIFTELGVKRIDTLDIRTRDQAHQPDYVEKVSEASVLFLTGGDQLRITSQFGDTPVFQMIQERYRKGLSIVGTSAGAAAMPQTMLVSGAGDESTRISAVGMAPGLGLIDGVVIDSHFAERGRIGRLLGAVTQNPANLGLGIDEDTALYIEQGNRFTVIGSGAVYVIDGSSITGSNLSEERLDGILTVYDVRLHVLGEGECFDLTTRQPITTEESHESENARAAGRSD